jgi:hypothetical protein
LIMPSSCLYRAFIAPLSLCLYRAFIVPLSRLYRCAFIVVPLSLCLDGPAAGGFVYVHQCERPPPFFFFFILPPKHANPTSHTHTQTMTGGYQVFAMGHGSVSNEIKGRRGDGSGGGVGGWQKTLLSIDEEAAVFR